MEAQAFARNVERQVRKALKTERVEGEYQQKKEKSVRYRRFSALRCYLVGLRTHKVKSFINPLRSLLGLISALQKT